MIDESRTAETLIPGTLYVVATPIGNLGDISDRALSILGRVDRIAAEDTRHSRRLLSHFAINVPLVSLHEHNEQQRIPQLIAALQDGQTLALISDAGTPLVSDPGFRLLRAVREHRLRAVPVPGPSSAIAALSVAGLPADRFVFEGFLSAKAGQRRQRLEQLVGETRTLILFEASHRIDGLLADLMTIFGPERPVSLARELTKLHEQIITDRLAAVCDWLMADEQRRRGEFVIVVGGASATEAEPDEIEQRRLLKVLLEELPVKKAAAVAARLTGGRKNDLYALALTLNDRG